MEKPSKTTAMVDSCESERKKEREEKRIKKEKDFRERERERERERGVESERRKKGYFHFPALAARWDGLWSGAPPIFSTNL